MMDKSYYVLHSSQERGGKIMKFWTTVCAVMLIFVTFSNTGIAAPPDGLVLYLPMDEGQGNTAEDMSGRGNHGTLMGSPKWVDGKIGSALQFSGEENSNYVEVPDGPDVSPSKEMTCMAWIYFDDFHSSCGVISKYMGAGNNRCFNLRMSHTVGSFALASECSSDGTYSLGTSATAAETDPNTLVAGQWQHIAMTFKAEDYLRLYVNGELMAESESDATESLFDSDLPLLIGTDFEIGGNHGGQPREFTGIIDEVAIFNRQLSSEEIQSILDVGVMSVEPGEKLASTWGDIKR
jgi:hypothetical protein